MRERNRWTKLQELYFYILFYQMTVSGNKQEKKIASIRQQEFDIECISRRSIHERSHDSLLGHLSGPYVLIAPPPQPWPQDRSTGIHNQIAGKYSDVGS